MEYPPDIDLNALFEEAGALLNAGRLTEALAVYKRLLRMFPDDAELLYLTGKVELQLGNPKDGAMLLRVSLSISPDRPNALSNLALALYKLGLFQEALEKSDRAIALNPSSPHAYIIRSDVLRDMGLLEESLQSGECAMKLFPGDPGVSKSRGMTLARLGRQKEADAYFELTIGLDPDKARAYLERANLLYLLKRWDDTLADCERVIALAPDLASAHLLKALVLLLNRDFANGLPLYEWRWKKPEFVKNIRNLPWPLWMGDQPIAGRNLLVHAEQGLGDVIHMIRYAPRALARGARVVIEAPKRLLPLLSTLKGDFAFVETGQPLPECDFYCPVMSLPLAFKTRLDTVPAEVPYLFVDAQRQAQWRQRLGPKTKPRIGLTWAGNPNRENDILRSLRLRQFEPLLQLPFEFHSLQQENRPEDAAILPAFPQLRTHHNEQNDLADAAALVAEMDLVITVDTVAAHIAGAIGSKVWILLAWVPDWRWMLDRSDSPWYPTARLFRQPAAGDWDSVICEICDKLRTDL